MISGLRPGDDQQSLEPYFELLKLVTRSLTIIMLCGAVSLQGLASPSHAWRSAVLYIPLGFFCLFALMSTAWSALKGETLGQAGSFTTLVLLSYATSLVVRTPIDFSNLLRGQITLVVFICAFLLVTGIFIPQTGHMSRDGDGLGHATNAGSTSALGSLILFLIALLSSWRWPWSLLVLGGPILGAVSIFSANRLSMFITAILATLAICFYASRYISATLLIAVGIFGTLFVAIDPDCAEINRARKLDPYQAEAPCGK
jgi:hypothetical protein